MSSHPPYPELPSITHFDQTPNQEVTTPTKPRKKSKNVSDRPGGLRSSPVAGVQSGLTPDQSTRRRAASTSRAPTSATDVNGSPVATSLSSVTPPRPGYSIRPKPQNTVSLPDLPGSEERKRKNIPQQPERAQTDPFPLSKQLHYSQIDRKLQLRIERGPLTKEYKKIDRAGYGYTYMLRVQPTATMPGLLKIGFSSNDPKKRATTIRAKCHNLKTEEHVDAIAQSAPFYWVAEKLVHDELANYRYNWTCSCGTNHTEYFQVPEQVALDSLTRWRLFCEKRPWDEQGRLKPRWINRLQNRYRYVDTTPRTSLFHSRRLARHWKAFTDPWWSESFCNDSIDVLKRMFTWRLHFLAISEALALALRIPLHSWALYWVGFVVLLVFVEFARIEDMYTTERIASLCKGGWQRFYVRLDGLGDIGEDSGPLDVEYPNLATDESVDAAEANPDLDLEDEDVTLLGAESDVDMEEDNDVGDVIDMDEDMELPPIMKNGYSLDDSVSISDTD